MIPLKGIFLLLILNDPTMTLGMKQMPDMDTCRRQLIQELNTGKFKRGDCLEGGMIMSPSIATRQFDLLRGMFE
jgi:hypothetical protein